MSMITKKPRILMVYTGGTIGMIEDAETHALRPFDFTHLMDNVPKVKKLDYEIDNIQFNPPIDSSDMNLEHWRLIARSIADNYDRYDGFVVLHGTDTMAYTASALSFMLQGLSKPVIITGSQLPIGEVRTDGEEKAVERQLGAVLEADARDVVAALDRSQLLRADLDGIGDRCLERLAVCQQHDLAGMRLQDLRFVQGILA